MGAGVSVLMLAFAGFFLRSLLRVPVSFSSFVLGLGTAVTFVVATLFLYWTFSCWRLKYALDESGFTIRWGPVRHVVPLRLIEKVIPGDELEKEPEIRGLNWIGHHVGFAMLGTIGRAVFYSTHRSRRDLVYVVTPGLTYGISPPNPKGFVAQLAGLQQRRYGPASRPSTERWPLPGLSVRKDRYVQAIMLAGLAINAALFAYVTYYFPSLPELLPMHFTVLGEVDLIGFRSEVLKLPAMAFVVLACNTALALLLHSRERLAAYMCVVAAFFVQVVFWVATMRIVY